MEGAGEKYHALREDYPGHTNGESLANGEENLEVSVCVDGLKLKSCTTVSDEIEKQLVDENCLSIVFLMLQPSCHVLCNSVFSPIAKWSLCLINLIREQLSKTKVFCVIFLRLCNLHRSACTYKSWIS
jgi:hypothetical protein